MVDHSQMFIRVTSDVLQLDQLSAFVQDPGAGAVATFTGTTRDSFQGKKVVRLEYEAYAPMAEAKLKVNVECQFNRPCISYCCATLPVLAVQELCQIAMMRWQIKRVAVAHRTGVCPIGEASVIIAMSSAHRKDALEVRQASLKALGAKTLSCTQRAAVPALSGAKLLSNANCSCLQLLHVCSFLLNPAGLCLGNRRAEGNCPNLEA